jgi:hypothetical protein
VINKAKWMCAGNYKKRQWGYVKWTGIRWNYVKWGDCLCGLVVRLPGCRPRGSWFDYRRYQIFWVAVGLERGPLSPCEDKWGATWKTSSGSSLENWD